MKNQPEVTIEKWFTDGWKLYTKNRFTFFFASLLATLICIPPFFVFFAAPLYAGLYYMALKSMRGEKARIRDIFKGFQRYWAAFFLWLIFLVAATLLCATAIGLLVVPMIWAISMLAFPLLIDERQPVGASFRMAFSNVFTFSWNRFGYSLKRWGQFWLYGLALSFISLMGVFGFFIGVFITLPFAVCTQVIAYRDIFRPEEAFQAETAQLWQPYPFKLRAKYIGPISQIRELRDQIFQSIETTNENVKGLLESSIEYINTVFAKAGNLIFRLQQIDDYLLTTDVQKLHREKADITLKMAESPNKAVYAQYEEAFRTFEERIDNHERIEELAAQINAQLTTIRVSLENTHAKIVRIKTTGLSDLSLESENLSKTLRNLQIEMDALLGSLDEMEEMV